VAVYIVGGHAPSVQGAAHQNVTRVTHRRHRYEL
jgi:hypothetical protein